MTRPTLLIVDDEYRIGQMISRLIHFEELGIELAGVFDNSEQAYEAILRNPPDIVISDIKMPVMDGLELVKKVLERHIHSHFIFISGFREFEYAHRALKYGVEDYLLKPVKEEELNTVLRRVCSAHVENIEHTLEIKRLQEDARRGQLVAGADAVSALSQGSEEKEWPTFNQTYRTHFQSGNLLAIVFQLDHRKLEEQDEILDHLVINNVVDIVESRLRPQVYELLSALEPCSGVLCILNYSSSKGSDIRRELHTVFANIKQYLRGFSEYEVTMALGDETADSAAAITIASARHRIRQRITLGIDRIITNTEWKNFAQADMELTISERSQLNNAAESLSAKGLHTVLENIWKRFQAQPDCDPASYYLLAGNITSHLFAALGHGHSLQKEQAEIQQLLQRCWSSSMLFETLCQALESIVTNLNTIQQTKASRPVRVAEEYIALHYAEKITLEEISAHLQMNASYFSMLFKKQTGKNFQTYLQDYRIDRAKELLRTTNDTMMSIAEQVGYTDTRYFSQSFAKVVGIKPSLYRKMYF